MAAAHQLLKCPALTGSLLLAGCLLACTGCSDRPKAPALEDSAVYHNPREGFRFRVPTGWIQRAKADFPREKVPEERMLVQYVRRTAEGQATLEASMIDLPDEVDVRTLLTPASHGSETWRTTGPGERIQLNGVSALRVALDGKHGKTPMTKEVTVFRRGERIYLLTAIFKSGDKSAREQTRGAAASVMWKD
jgi:hypothetical protein